jgi:hypothetical protein
MNIDLHDWMLDWLLCQDPLGVQLFCVLLWKYWAGRNAAVFNGVQLDPTRLALDAMSFVHDFNEANPPKIRRATMAQVPIQQNTVNTVFSLFVDVGCSSSGPTVWGLVLRNSDGETVLSACKREDFSVDPLMAEAMGFGGLFNLLLIKESTLFLSTLMLQMW